MVRRLLQLNSTLINWFDSSIGSTCSPELRHGLGLFICDVLIIFSELGLSCTNLVSNCVFMCQMFFFPTINSTLSGHVIDHALNWKKYDHLGYKR